MPRTLLAPFTPHTLCDDSLLLLRCDEASGALVDAAGLSTFTDFNTVQVADSLYDPDTSGTGARLFNGTNEYQTGTSTAAQRSAAITDAFCVSFWMRPTNTSQTNASIIGLGGTAETEADNFLVLLQQEGTEIEWLWESGAGTNHTATTSGLGLVAGTDYFVSLVRRRASNGNPAKCDVEIRVRAKGAPTWFTQKWANQTLPTGGSSAVWSVGATSVPDQYWAGRLDDIHVGGWSAPEYAIDSILGNYQRHFDQQYLLRQEDLDPNRATYCGERNVFVRVRVEDWNGDLVDLTDLYGRNFVSSVEGEIGIDGMAASCTVNCIARHEAVNLSPLVISDDDHWNPVNMGGEVLLKSNRRIVVETAVVPANVTEWDVRCLSLWCPEFEGLIADVGVSGAEVVIRCIDMMDALNDVWVEADENGYDREYGDVAGTPAEGELEQLIYDNDPGRFDIISVDDNGGLRQVTTATNSGLQPGKAHHLQLGDIFTVTGTTNFDGEDDVSATSLSRYVFKGTDAWGAFAAETAGEVHTALTYKGGRPTLWAPTATSWNLWLFRQGSSESVAGALQRWMDQIGYACRYAWDDERRYFRLAVFATVPGSGNVLTGPWARYDSSKAGRRKDDVRTVAAVEYGENASLDNVGNRRKHVVQAVGLDAFADFGRRYCRFGMESEGLVNEASEAQTLASGAVGSLALEGGDGEHEVPYDPSTLPGDTLYFSDESTSMVPIFIVDAPGALGSKVGRIISRRWTISSGKARCSYRTLKQGSGAIPRVGALFESIQVEGAVTSLGTAPPAAPPTPTLAQNATFSTLRTCDIRWAAPVDQAGNRQWDTYEVHQSTSSPLTPSSSTLVGVVRGTRAGGYRTNAGFLYVVLVPRDALGNVGPQSGEASINLT